MKLIPFANDAASISLGKLTIENGLDCLALYGSLDITHDQRGLDLARQLKALLDQAVTLLEHDPGLPATVEDPAPAKTVKNPFA